jgi:hypothetical protein
MKKLLAMDLSMIDQGHCSASAALIDELANM